MNDVETGYEEAVEAAWRESTREGAWFADKEAEDGYRAKLVRIIEAAAPYMPPADEHQWIRLDRHLDLLGEARRAAEEKVKRELLERLSTPAAVDAFHAALPGPQRYSVVDTIAALRAAYEASTTQPLAGADDER